MPTIPSPPASRLAATMAIALVLFSAPPGRTEATPPVRLMDLPAIKQLQRDLNNQGEKRRLREAAERAREMRIRGGKNAQLAKPGSRARKRVIEAGERVRPAAPHDGAVLGETALPRGTAPERSGPGVGLDIVPGNVRHNNPAADGLSSAQSEVSLAIVGQYGLSSWNDGEGFITYPPIPNGQGVSYTTNGGTTWTDVGLPPLTGTITDWISDPVVAVNEKTGEFWFCALTENGASNFGIAVVRATFPGGVFTWDTPRIVRDLPGSTDFLDKQWLVADSTNGNLYLTYTHFTVSGSTISFQRSIDGGVSWGPELPISTSSGDVQASRPVVAGNSTLYVTWKQIGPADVDFVRVRRSIDQGLSFQPQNPGFSYYDNFGTGAPGFNRNRNVVEPCPVVDRSHGAHRGRLHAVVHESLNFYNDPIGGGGAKSEPKQSATTEVNNNFFSRAVPFVAGQHLRGELRPSGDFDYWSFTATAGTSYIFLADSIPTVLYTLRLFCGSDTLTRLAYAGDVDAPAGSQSLVVWTAPATGTYYLRIAHVVGGASFGGYHLVTGTAAAGSEPGRDQRDIVAHYSDDGGATWSAAKRINDDIARYDNFLPEIGITTEGFPYAAWYDWRDAASTCGGSSHVYVSRSLDGGNTWAQNQRVSTAPTAWTTAATNIQPNEGDYIGLYAGDVVALGWGDARAGEADINVWGTNIPTQWTVSCPNDTTVAQSSTLNVNVAVTNGNPVYANTYAGTLSNDHAWATTAPGTALAAADGGVGNFPISITIPDTASGTARICIVVALGARSSTCCFNVTVQGVAAVGDGPGGRLTIHGLAPNPASSGLAVSFSLPSAGPARIELLDVNGRRVAERDVALGAGRHVVSFGSEIAALESGIYAVKLVQNGRHVVSKVSVVR